MKIALTTPTGNIGRKVADALVGGEHKITLICRHAEKVADLVEKGAIIREGSQGDAGFLREATKRIDVLFWVTPVDHRTPDLRADQRRFGDMVASAIQVNRIVRVVNLSSVGAQHETDVGPIGGLYDIEQRLNQTGAYITHFRPAFFFENFLAQLEAIHSAGSIFLPIPGSTRLSMIATADVARAAADRLTEKGWTGRPVWDLLGPEDLSFDEAADRIAEGIGKPVKVVEVDEAAFAGSLREMGISESAVSAIVEIYRGFESGRVQPETPRSAASTTPTKLEEFAREVMKPLLEQPVAG
jgi:uncharacterized protein YbjT (DUF2867 family)